jgi:hypothetical protein
VVGYLSIGVILLLRERRRSKEVQPNTDIAPLFIDRNLWRQMEILYNTEFLFIKCNGRSVRVALYRSGYIGFVYMSRKDDVERRGSKHRKMKEKKTDASESGRGEQFGGELTKCTFIQQIFLVINVLILDVPLLVFHFNLVKSLLMFRFGKVRVLTPSDLSSNLALSFHICNALFADSISHKMRNFHKSGCNGPLMVH